MSDFEANTGKMWMCAYNREAGELDMIPEQQLGWLVQRVGG
jgi:hypothetical protein